ALPPAVEAPCMAARPVRRHALVQDPSALHAPVQATTNPSVAVPPPVIEPPAAAGLPPSPHLARGPGEDPEDCRRHLIQRLFLLPEILRIVRAGLGAAMRVAEVRF
ncbi:hypothetical protein C0995_006442, partial [Termitomyces sp. Mi166